MGIGPYHLMSPGEIHKFSPSAPVAVLLCCAPFSPGLLIGPSRLPKGSVAVFTDRVTPTFHQSGRIAGELKALMKTLHSPALILDWTGELSPWLEELLKQLCGVQLVLPPHLAGKEDSAVLVPSVVEKSLEDLLAPWNGRQIWLDMVSSAAQLTLTRNGCEVVPWQASIREGDLYDETLCCQYRVETAQEEARFYLYETQQTRMKKLEKARSLGVAGAIGLWKDFKK